MKHLQLYESFLYGQMPISSLIVGRIIKDKELSKK
jgi:hypothetical protein